MKPKLDSLLCIAQLFYSWSSLWKHFLFLACCAISTACSTTCSIRLLEYSCKFLHHFRLNDFLIENVTDLENTASVSQKWSAFFGGPFDDGLKNKRFMMPAGNFKFKCDRWCFAHWTITQLFCLKYFFFCRISIYCTRANTSRKF